MRTAYLSKWRLFRDSADTLTRGRYYRCPDDTPFYPGWHWLGSKDWDDSNWEHVANLGEDRNAQRQYEKGIPPATLPRVKFTGTTDCIESGALLASALPASQLDDGFPVGCYTPAVPTDPNWHRIASVWHCRNQRVYAQILQLMYDDNSGPAVWLANRWFGNVPVITFHPQTATLPAVMTIICDEYSAALVTGTNDFQQFALQAFYAFAGPTNFGAYSTNPQWDTAATWIHNFLLADGADPDRPIFFAGHSYGAVSALILAARYRFANADRQIRYNSYGCPKIGDARLAALVKTCPGVDLSNSGDFVTVLPPDQYLLWPVFVTLGVPFLINWTQWEFPPNLTLQLDDGHLIVNQPPTLDSFTLLGYSIRALANLQIDEILQHNLDIYVERIALRCNDDQYPASAALGLNNPIDAPSDRLGLLGFDVADGRLGLLGYDPADGRLGLGAQELAEGLLGLRADDLRIADGRLGLSGPIPPDMADGRLGLFGPDAPVEIPGSLGLFGPSPLAGANASLGLRGPNPLGSGWEDSFTDVDSTLLTDHVGENTPGGYTAEVNNFQCFGNVAVMAIISGDFCTVSFDPGLPDFVGSVSFEVPAIAQSAGHRFVVYYFRFVDFDNNFQVVGHWAPGSDSSDAWILQKVVSGSFTTLATGSSGHAAATLLEIEIIDDGSDISATFGGDNQTASDGDLAGNTRQALQMNTGGANTTRPYFDDLLVE